MADPYVEVGGAAAEIETREWLESLGYVLEHSGPGRVRELLEQLLDHARQQGVQLPSGTNTPYINTIPATRQPPYPGSRDLERNIRNIIRWNAMVMVVRANLADATMGGHIATYASAARRRWCWPRRSRATAWARWARGG